MARLEDLTRGTVVDGILPDAHVTVVDVKWIGSVAVELTVKAQGKRSRWRCNDEIHLATATEVSYRVKVEHRLTCEFGCEMHPSRHPLPSTFGPTLDPG